MTEKEEFSIEKGKFFDLKTGKFKGEKEKQSLSEYIRSDKTPLIHKKTWEKMKTHIQNAQRRIKDEIIFNDIYTADEIFRIINKVFKEEFGKKLTGENLKEDGNRKRT